MDDAGKITREEAINILHGIQADNLNLDNAYTKDKYEALDMAITALEQEPKTGHWMEKKHNRNMIMYHRYKCSVCDEKAKGRTGIWVQLFDYKYNYCPNCGAKMESEE